MKMDTRISCCDGCSSYYYRSTKIVVKWKSSDREYSRVEIFEFGVVLPLLGIYAGRLGVGTLCYSYNCTIVIGGKFC